MPRQNSKSVDGKPVRRKQSPPDRYQPPSPPSYSPTPLSTSRRQGRPPPLILTRHSPYQRTSAQHNTSRHRVPSLSPTESTRPNTATSSVFSPKTPYAFPCAAPAVSYPHPSMAIRGWHPQEPYIDQQDSHFPTKPPQHKPIIDTFTPSQSFDLARSSSLPSLPVLPPILTIPHSQTSPIPPLSPSARFLKSITTTTIPPPPIHSSPTPYHPHTSPFRPWVDSPPRAPYLSFIHRLDSPIPVPPYTSQGIEVELSGFVPLKPTLGALMDSGSWVEEEYGYGIGCEGLRSDEQRMDVDDLRGVEHLMGLGLRVQ